MQISIEKTIFTNCQKSRPLTPYPQILVRRQGLGDEKKILRRTALPENSNGNKVSRFAAAAFPEQRFGCYLRDLDL